MGATWLFVVTMAVVAGVPPAVEPWPPARRKKTPDIAIAPKYFPVKRIYPNILHPAFPHGAAVQRCYLEIHFSML
jgi:hypothetical protein